MIAELIAIIIVFFIGVATGIKIALISKEKETL